MSCRSHPPEIVFHGPMFLEGIRFFVADEIRVLLLARVAAAASAALAARPDGDGTGGGDAAVISAKVGKRPVASIGVGGARVLRGRTLQ